MYTLLSGLFGIFMLFTGVSEWRENRQFARYSTDAVAVPASANYTITTKTKNGSEVGRSYSANLKYTTATGEVVVVHKEFTESDLKSFQNGEGVPIKYMPNATQSVRLQSENHDGAGFTMVVGLVSLGLSVFLVRRSRARSD